MISWTQGLECFLKCTYLLPLHSRCELKMGHKPNPQSPSVGEEELIKISSVMPLPFGRITLCPRNNMFLKVSRERPHSLPLASGDFGEK